MLLGDIVTTGINFHASQMLHSIHDEMPSMCQKLTAIHGQLQHVADAVPSTDAEWRDKCLIALFCTDPVDDRARLITSKGQRVQGTCEWIMTNEIYKSWLTSPSQALWLSGSLAGPERAKLYFQSISPKSSMNSPGSRKELYLHSSSAITKMTGEIPLSGSLRVGNNN